MVVVLIPGDRVDCLDLLGGKFIHSSPIKHTKPELGLCCFVMTDGASMGLGLSKHKARPLDILL